MKYFKIIYIWFISFFRKKIDMDNLESFLRPLFNGITHIHCEGIPQNSPPTPRITGRVGQTQLMSIECEITYPNYHCRFSLRIDSNNQLVINFLNLYCPSVTSTFGDGSKYLTLSTQMIYLNYREIETYLRNNYVW